MLLSGVNAGPVAAPWDRNSKSPTSLYEPNIGDTEVLRKLPHGLGPSQFVKILSREPNLGFFFVTHC